MNRERVDQDGNDTFTRHWRFWLLAAWILAAAWLTFDRWNQIRGFGLPDTDDNMRMMQVRGLLAGQEWFDLRQYRLDPPFGANIHWSRLVDLPIAGIILLIRPLAGGPLAEKVAVTLAPMLPMALAMVAVALITRRILNPKALLIAFLLLMCAHSTRLMWSPLRIDHHGWQLAFLILGAASFTDRDRLRGGIILGLATAASLTIGLEMLLYLALSGALLGLIWVRNGEETPRMLGYGITLAGGSAAGFLLFASYANRAPVCDALSPVWLSATVAAGALCTCLALLRPRTTIVRLVLAVAAGLALAAAFVLAWPHCLGRLEGVSPEAQRLWLNNVREARPIYRQSTQVLLAFLSLPLVGLAGYAAMLWRHRRAPDVMIPWGVLATLAFTAFALLFWQTRAGAAAQLLAVPGATGLAWVLLVAIHRSQWMLVRVVGTVAGFFLASGFAFQFVATFIPAPKEKEARTKVVNRANALCPTLAALRPVALLPKGYVLTFVDLGPRLITVTHHDAVTGPYHRNYKAIVDIMQTFRGSAEHAHAMVARRNIDYVLICPNFSEATNYQVQAPKGFYAQLAKGKAPAWLSPIPLPAKSPYRMWKVIRVRTLVTNGTGR